MENLTEPKESLVSHPKILIVDDEKQMCECLCATLEGLGFAPFFTSDPLAALDLARLERPDLVLADVTMPSMDGYALMDAFHRDPEMCACPVVLITGRLEFTERMQAYRRGAQGFLTKPVLSDRLLASIKRALDGKASSVS